MAEMLFMLLLPAEPFLLRAVGMASAPINQSLYLSARTHKYAPLPLAAPAIMKLLLRIWQVNRRFCPNTLHLANIKFDGMQMPVYS